MNYVVKEVRINVRTSDEIKRDLEITATLRGMSVSALVNSLVVKAIREEKTLEPHAFKTQRIGILKEAAGDASQEEDEDDE